MRLADAIRLHCTFGGGGGDSASSTMPLHGHPETPFNRAKQRKGGADKGGVTAGGQGSGCKGSNCGRPKTWGDTRKEFVTVLKKHEVEHNLASASTKDFYSQGGSAHPKVGGNIHIYGDGSWTHHGTKSWSGRRGTLPQDMGKGSGAKALDEHLSKLKEVKGAARKKKVKRPALRGTSGGQSEGSSLISRNYKVVDGMGRKIHEYRTKEEAETASAGNRYSKVWKSTIPDSDSPEVRDMVRKRPGDTQVRTFRRSMPFPNTPFPQGPMGR